MPTSNSYDSSITRDSIITAAFRKIGALGDFESISPEKLAAGIAALNPMVKALANKGMPLWAITEQEIPFNTWAEKSTVTIGPAGDISQPVKPLKILQALRRNVEDPASTVDVPMNIYTYEDYENLATKQARGAPLHIFYQPQGYMGTISLWPLPDVYWQTNGTLYIRYQRPFQDFDTATDEPDFPVEWHEALIYGLAVRLAPEYGVALNERALLLKEFQLVLDDALSFGTEEGSLYVMPDRRWQAYGKL